MSSNNYIYDETQPSGHGFSFSHKMGYDITSPKARNLASRLEKNEELFSNRTNAQRSAKKGGRTFDLSPELTLDDLREKLKAGGGPDHTYSKKNDDLSDILQSSLNAGGNRALHQSISPKAKTFSEQNQRKYTPGKESQFEGSDFKDSYRPYSSQAYRSPKGSYQKDGLLSSSPYQTYTQSISSYLKSPTRNIYNNDDLSDRQSLKTLHTNYSEQEQSLKYSKSHKYNPLTNLTDAIRSRSSTPKKDKLGYTDTKLYFGGPTYLLNSNNENSQSLQQELKAKIEQFNKKLVEVQEGLGQSKSSQDPYQISLRSMKPLPNEDLLDGSKSKKTLLSSVGDENSKNLGNKDDRNQPLNIHNLTETQKSASDVSNDYSHKFQQMKLKYNDMFKPQEMKTMTNPYKILRHRFDKKLDGLVKDYVDQTTVLQSEIDKNLFFTNTQ